MLPAHGRNTSCIISSLRSLLVPGTRARALPSSLLPSLELSQCRRSNFHRTLETKPNDPTQPESMNPTQPEILNPTQRRTHAVHPPTSASSLAPRGRGAREPRTTQIEDEPHDCGVLQAFGEQHFSISLVAHSHTWYMNTARVVSSTCSCRVCHNVLLILGYLICLR